MKLGLNKHILIFSLLSIFIIPSFAQKSPIDKADYRMAERFSPTKIQNMVFSLDVRPKWLETGDQFWYTYKTTEGTFYYLVDLEKQSKKPLFDNHHMATQLTLITKDPYDLQHLPDIKPDFVKGDKAFQFDVTNTQFEEKKKEEVVDSTDMEKEEKDIEIIKEDEEEGEKKKDGDKKADQKKKDKKDKPKKKVFHLEYNIETGELKEIENWEKEIKDPDWANISPNDSLIIFARDYNLYWKMFVVRNAYRQKAINTVRWHGNLNFGGGGNFHDVIWVYENQGAISEEAYAGLEYGEEKHVHGELDALLEGYVETVIKNKNRKISPAWHQGFNGVLDAYFGEVPASFEMEGTSYNTTSYAEELGLNMDDYVEITSFNHHPFYESFILEIPDNWMLAEFYNLPLEELMKVIEHALMEGYSVGWDADVSEKGFSWKNGVAIVPNEEQTEIAGMESEKWEKMDEKEKAKLLYSFEEPVAEKEITQELRQEQFDNYKTTDDHLMLLTGIARDQRGKTFFKVKNSWSEKGSPYEGFFFASTPYIELKTLSIILHKEAIPKEIKERLSIQ